MEVSSLKTPMCSVIASNPVRTRAAAILIKDGKILLMHRKNHGKEYYVFPGGGHENGETLKETVKREIKEETTMDIKVGKKLFHIIWDDGSQNYFYLCEHISGEPYLSPDSIEALVMKSGQQYYNPEWIDINEFPKMLVFQLEIRDLVIEGIKDNFKRPVQILSLKISDKRKV